MRIPLLLLSLFVQSAFAGDWPEFMGPARDQTSPETEILDSMPAGGPPLLWDKEIGTGYSAPSVRGKLLVLHHRVAGEEVVEAFDAASGESRWRFGYPSSFTDPFGFNNGPRCTPLLTEDRCFTMGAEGVLLCVELATGKQVWRRDTQKDFEVPPAFFGAGSSPLLEGGLLIVQVGGQPDSCLVAFDAATGKTVWQNVGEKSWTGVPMSGWPGERTVQWNRSNPIYEKQASYCTPVAATIRYRGPLLDYGNVMILEPGGGYLLIMSGLQTVYGEVGDVIGAGQPLGLMGGNASDGADILSADRSEVGVTGSETLYVEVRQRAEPVDPLEWFEPNEE